MNYIHLTMEERTFIAKFKEMNMSLREMAKILNRYVLTIKHLKSYLMSNYVNVVLDMINYRTKLIKRVYIK